MGSAARSKKNASGIPVTVIGAVAGTVVGAAGTLLFPPAAPATVPMMLAPLGLSLGGSAVIGGGVIGGLIGSQAEPDQNESSQDDEEFGHNDLTRR
jgi:hypothetical protein